MVINELDRIGVLRQVVNFSILEEVWEVNDKESQGHLGKVVGWAQSPLRPCHLPSLNIPVSALHIKIDEGRSHWKY